MARVLLSFKVNCSMASRQGKRQNSGISWISLSNRIWLFCAAIKQTPPVHYRWRLHKPGQTGLTEVDSEQSRHHFSSKVSPQYGQEKQRNSFERSRVSRMTRAWSRSFVGEKQTAIEKSKLPRRKSRLPPKAATLYGRSFEMLGGGSTGDTGSIDCASGSRRQSGKRRIRSPMAETMTVRPPVAADLHLTIINSSWGQMNLILPLSRDNRPFWRG